MVIAEENKGAAGTVWAMGGWQGVTVWSLLVTFEPRLVGVSP